MPLIEAKVQGLEGLVRATLEIARALPDGSFLWFRGLSSGAHQLLPTIMREGKTAEQVFERERRLLTRFRQRSLAYWPAGYPQNDWEHLFAMQHFGAPTRLLDWTENVFVAAHFALSSWNASASSAPVIWCTDPIAWNRAMPVLSEFGDTIQVLTTSDEELEAYRPNSTKRRFKSPVAIFGTHNSARIVAQRGTFMIWGNEVKPLEGFAGETDGPLWRLEIEGDREELARDIGLLGFGETMVVPELSALASELSKTEGWRS